MSKRFFCCVVLLYVGSFSTMYDARKHMTQKMLYARQFFIASVYILRRVAAILAARSYVLFSSPFSMIICIFRRIKPAFVLCFLMFWGSSIFAPQMSHIVLNKMFRGSSCFRCTLSSLDFPLNRLIEIKFIILL